MLLKKKPKDISIAQEVICVETDCGVYQMDEQGNLQPNTHWVTFNRKVLSFADKEIIVKG